MDYRLQYILDSYPNAKCELDYSNLFRLLIAVVLSAQTTDIKVNKVTPVLFSKYQTIEDLANANLEDVKVILKPIGMTSQKGKHIIEIAKIIHTKYNDEIPRTKEELTMLPGVGNKTTNVMFAEGFKIPALPVDTHINRIAKRLKFATLSDDVDDVERKLKKQIPEELWIQMHHSMIFFGRYFCKAISPNCENCKLKDVCRKKYK